MGTRNHAGDLPGARRELLARALSERFATPAQVLSMQLTTGGNSRETWIAEVALGSGPRRLVLRCDPDHWIRPEQMQREIQGLELAARAGVPVPRVLVSSQQVELGRPYVVTDFVDGTAIARRIMRDDSLAPARARFAAQCGEILACLHRAGSLVTHWRPYDPIQDLRCHLDNTDFPSPVLQGALAWLCAHRPGSPESLGPVHRDFRLGNLMLQPSGIVAVLDWETCQLGDPDEDLAWLCARSWRYGSELPVGGLGTMSDLLHAYEHSSGRKVDPKRLHWWSVYAETRWGLAGMARLRPGSAGGMMEQAAIMRLAARQEYNVLLELQGVVEGR